MSDDFGTVNVKRGDRAREIEVLRGQYRTHREALARLMSEAPSEALAADYQRVIVGIDNSLRKLDELEGRPTPAATSSGVPSLAARAPLAAESYAETQRGPATSAGNRPLMTPPQPAREPVGRYTEPEPANSGSRTLLIVAAGIIVLALIGWLVWRASANRRAARQNQIVEQPASAQTAEAPVTPAPATSATATGAGGALRVTPVLADYGVIRRGTRSVKQFEVTNGGSAPLEIQVARSNCRCLYYEYNKTVKPNSKETITVTVDGGKAKPGALDEQIAVSSKADPSLSATFEVRATVR